MSFNSVVDGSFLTRNENSNFVVDQPKPGESKKPDLDFCSKEITVPKKFNVIKDTLFCRNGNYEVITSDVPNVCLINVAVGEIFFNTNGQKNRISLLDGSSIKYPPDKTIASIHDMRKEKSQNNT